MDIITGTAPPCLSLLRVRPSICRSTRPHSAVLCQCTNSTLEAGLLLASGADVKAVSSAGFTALHLAAGNGKIESAKILLSAGADVTSTNNNGATPLALAVGHSNTVKSSGSKPKVRQRCTVQSRVAEQFPLPAMGDLCSQCALNVDF